MTRLLVAGVVAPRGARGGRRAARREGRGPAPSAPQPAPERRIVFEGPGATDFVPPRETKLRLAGRFLQSSVVEGRSEVLSADAVAARLPRPGRRGRADRDPPPRRRAGRLARAGRAALPGRPAAPRRDPDLATGAASATPGASCRGASRAGSASSAAASESSSSRPTGRWPRSTTVRRPAGAR